MGKKGSIQITPAESRRDLKEFILFPRFIYTNDSFWVPPFSSFMKQFLNPRKNPFFRHSEASLFLARKAGACVGRVAAILNKNHNRFQNEKASFFGFFESVDDPEVAKALFNEAEGFGRQRGMAVLRGPVNFSTNDECGLLVEGFDGPPVVMMPYNPPFYLPLIEEAGFHKAKDLLAYHMTDKHGLPPKFVRVAERIRKKAGVEIRSLHMKRYREELEIFKEIYNEAWESNWGFVPMTAEEFEFMAKTLKGIVNPGIIFIASVNGEPAGFSLSIPDVNVVLKKMDGSLFPFGIFHLLFGLKRIRRLRLMGLGIKKKFQKRGIDALFYLETWREGIRLGFREAEFSWLLEDNLVMNQTLLHMGLKPYRRYRIFEKSLS